MWMLLLLLLLLILCAAPVQVQADVCRADQTLLRLRLTCAHLTRQWRLKLVRTPSGHQLVAMGQAGGEHTLAPEQMHGSPAERIVTALRASEGARGYLLRHVRLAQLDASLRLHTEDATRTALCTGFLRAMTVLLPPAWRSRARIRITPDFTHARTILQARCILRFRLGTIIITSALLLASAARQRTLKAREAA